MAVWTNYLEPNDGDKKVQLSWLVYDMCKDRLESGLLAAIPSHVK